MENLWSGDANPMNPVRNVIKIGISRMTLSNHLSGHVVLP